VAGGLEPVADPEVLDAIARRIAREVSADHPDGLTLVGLLSDAVVFLADCCRHLTVPAALDFVDVAPYDGVQGRTRLVKDLDHGVAGRNVVLVTALVDTGLTVDFVRRHVLALGPASLRIAALADRPGRRLVPVEVAYRGIEVGERYLVGYGMDHHGRYRNVPGLWSADPDAVRTDPEATFGSLAPR